jgi:hypothetical protein
MLGGQKTIASRRSFAPAAYAQDDTGGELAETKKSYPTRESTFSFGGDAGFSGAESAIASRHEFISLNNR